MYKAHSLALLISFSAILSAHAGSGHIPDIPQTASQAYREKAQPAIATIQAIKAQEERSHRFWSATKMGAIACTLGAGYFILKSSGVSQYLQNHLQTYVASNMACPEGASKVPLQFDTFKMLLNLFDTPKPKMVNLPVKPISCSVSINPALQEFASSLARLGKNAISATVAAAAATCGLKASYDLMQACQTPSQDIAKLKTEYNQQIEELSSENLSTIDQAHMAHLII